MDDEYAITYGDLINWPTKDEMAALLEKAGLNVNVGVYAIRVQDCTHFVFREFGGDIDNPCITAYAEDVKKMIEDATLVSNALKLSNICHSFEIYDENDEFVQKIEFNNA